MAMLIAFIMAVLLATCILYCIAYIFEFSKISREPNIESGVFYGEVNFFLSLYFCLSV